MRDYHERLQAILEEASVTFQYPQFIGSNHRAHVTQRNGKDFPPERQVTSSTVYLIEVVDGQRIPRVKVDSDIQK